MLLRQLFDYETWTYTYLLADEESREAVLIDPVIDQIDALLPQTQCAQCGYPGCRPYAEAIAQKFEAEIILLLVLQSPPVAILSDPYGGAALYD